MADQQKQDTTDALRYVSERKKREKEARPVVMQPPLTPMIDVVFQLLIFFLLACQFRQAEGQIPANLPDISGPAQATPFVDPIKITLRPTGPNNTGVLIEVKHANVTLTSSAELYAYLVKMSKIYGEGSTEKVPVVIKPLGDVLWEHVVNAFNQAIRAKYKQIGFAPS